jgi:hypothetical protein
MKGSPFWKKAIKFPLFYACKIYSEESDVVEDLVRVEFLVLDYFHHLEDFASVVLVNGAGKNRKLLDQFWELLNLNTYQCSGQQSEQKTG